MKVNSLVSVIVPVYNVQKYIGKCITSIQDQTYKNIEIIIINDGSLDNSVEIINECAANDNRIKIIHIDNNGVSNARNIGINTAVGEYVTFIDADDFIDSNFIEYMLSIVRVSKADFVLSRKCNVFPGPNKTEEVDKIEIITGEKIAVDFISPGGITIGCWNKMYKRDLLIKNNVSFPVNFFMGEGLNFIIQVAHISKTVGVGNKKVYNYRRDNPNSATTVKSVEKFINANKALMNIKNKYDFESEEYNHGLLCHSLHISLNILTLITESRSLDNYKEDYFNHLSFIRKNIFVIIKSSFSNKLKIKFLTYSFSPKASYYLFLCYKKIKASLHS